MDVECWVFIGGVYRDLQYEATSSVRLTIDMGELLSETRQTCRVGSISVSALMVAQFR